MHYHVDVWIFHISMEVHNSRDATLCKLQTTPALLMSGLYVTTSKCLMLQLGIMEVCSSNPPLSPHDHVTPEALKLILHCYY